MSADKQKIGRMSREKGKRGEMKAFFRDYLRSKYPDWDENKLVYKK